MEAKDWKDTVMSDEQLDDMGYPILPIGNRTGNRRIAEAQAEISFKAGERKVVDVLRQLDLFVGNCPPIESERYVYLGDYILRYGKNLEPQAGFYRLSDSPEWQAFLKSEGIE